MLSQILYLFDKIIAFLLCDRCLASSRIFYNLVYSQFVLMNAYSWSWKACFLFYVFASISVLMEINVSSFLDLM